MVDLLDATRSLPGSVREWLTGRTHAAGVALGLAGDIRVRIVRDDEMSRLHERFTGVAGPTDVLTFDFAGDRVLADDGAGGGGGVAPGLMLDVDVVVCLDVARREAAARLHRPEQELLLYIVHGLLHCAGFEDGTEAGAAAMHRREDEVLERLGVGAVFARGSRDPGAGVDG